LPQLADSDAGFGSHDAALRLELQDALELLADDDGIAVVQRRVAIADPRAAAPSVGDGLGRCA